MCTFIHGSKCLCKNKTTKKCWDDLRASLLLIFYRTTVILFDNMKSFPLKILLIKGLICISFLSFSDDFLKDSLVYFIHDFYYKDFESVKAEKLYKDAENYLNKSMPNNALPLLFELLELTEKGTDSYYNTQIKITEAYRQIREYNKGIDILYSVIEKNKSTESKVEVYAYTRLAALYNERPNSSEYRDSVIKYSRLALDISERKDYEIFIATSSNELGYVYRIKGEYNRALELFKKSKKIYEKNGKFEHAAGVAINLSTVYFELAQTKKAFLVLDEAIKYFDPETDYNILMRLYLHKSTLLAKTGDYKNAYVLLEKGRKLQKNFFIDRIDRQILDLSARYDLELKEAEFTKERILRERKERSIRVLIFIIILLLFLIVSVYFVFKLNRKTLEQKEKVSRLQNKILKTEFEQKTKELNNAIASTIAIEKVLKELRNEINAGNTKEAIHIINSNINTDNKWQEFILNFNKVYPDFFAKLHQKNPDLTDSEIRLSAMLKMNLKSMEIAKTLNIAISSVHKARQRLRKKLNLDSRSDISEYLSTL